MPEGRDIGAARSFLGATSFSAPGSGAPVQQGAYYRIKTFWRNQRDKQRQSNDNDDGSDAHERPPHLSGWVVFDKFSPIFPVGDSNAFTIRSVHASEASRFAVISPSATRLMNLFLMVLRSRDKG
jgi:hypothetical protein